MEAINIENELILMVNFDEEFTFTVCRSPQECTTYTRKGFELTAQEIALLKSEYMKANPEAAINYPSPLLITKHWK